MSLFVNGIQIDFNQAIVFDTENNGVSYQTLMTTQTESFTDTQFSLNQNPCVSSPCQNGEDCIPGYNNTYLCEKKCENCNNYQTEGPFSTTQLPSQSCNPNPCKNGGFCTVNKAQNISICLCSSLYTGFEVQISLKLCLHERIFFRTYCGKYKYSNNNNIGKSLAINENPSRLKRANQMNFFIEYLIVVDKTVVDQFNSIYQSLGNGNVNNYIRIMYSHLVNGV